MNSFSLLLGCEGDLWEIKDNEAREQTHWFKNVASLGEYLKPLPFAFVNFRKEYDKQFTQYAKCSCLF